MANDLIAVIKQKQAAIAKLEAELAEARALLTGERSTATHPTPRVPQPSDAKPRRGKTKKRVPSARHKVGAPGIVPTSSVGMAVEILRQAGKPVHINDIIKGIEGRGRAVIKTTLVGNLSRYVQQKRVFYRAAPSVFGLLELKKGA